MCPVHAPAYSLADRRTLMSKLSSRPRLSWLCGEVFPGQADDVDFFGGRLVGARCLKSCGDEDAAELAGHVGGRRLDLGGVPGGAGPVMCHVGGVVTSGGVPADGDGLAGDLEWDGPLDRAGGAVARLPGPEDLLAVFYRDLDRPAGGVPLDHLRGGGGGIGGDQGQVIAARWPVADQHDGDGPGAEDRGPQAGDRGGGDDGGLAVAGDGDRGEGGCGGEFCQGGQPVSPGPGPAALPGPGWREAVQGGVLAQPR